MTRGAVPGVRGGSAYRASGLEPGVHRGLPSTTLTMILSIDGPVVALEPPDAVGAARGRPDSAGPAAHDPAAPGALAHGPGSPGAASDRRPASRADLVLAGLHRSPVLVEQPSRQEGIQLELDPLMARSLLGVRAADLVGGFDGTEVLGRAGRDLWEQVGERAEASTRIALVARAFRSRLAGAPSRTGEVRAELAEAWRLVLASRGRLTVEDLAHRVLLSPRQLRSEFTREFGIGPKSAARLARFEWALEQIARSIHTGHPLDLSGIAAESGFADQSHMTREFTRFTGTAPHRWIREERRNLQAGGHGTADD